MKLLSEFFKRKDSKDGYRNECKVCLNKLHVIDYKLNREKRIIQSKSYYDLCDKNVRNIQSRAWAKSNKDKVYSKNKNYRKNNPGKISYDCAKRRAVKKKALPSWYKSEIKAIQELYLERNKWCDYGIDAHVDHIVPLQHPLVCGLHCFANLQVITAYDNMSKNNTFEV